MPSKQINVMILSALAATILTGIVHPQTPSTTSVVTNSAELESGIDGANQGQYDVLLIDASQSGNVLTLDGSHSFNMTPGLPNNGYSLIGSESGTVIDGGGHTTAILIDGTNRTMQDITLKDLSFENFASSPALWIQEGANVIFDGGTLTFRNNYGNAIKANTDYDTQTLDASFSFVNQGDLIFDTNGNYSDFGGALQGGDIIFGNQGNILVKNNTGYLGGGMALHYDRLVRGNLVRFDNAGDITFLGNSAARSGGALQLNLKSLEFNNLGNVYFIENTTLSEGGAIAYTTYSRGGQSDTMQLFANDGDVVFWGNHADYSGGAIHMSSFDGIDDGINRLTFANTGDLIFRKNSSRGAGAIDYSNDQEGAVLEFSNAGNIVFCQNVGSTVISLFNRSTLTINNGGNLFFTNNDMTLWNSDRTIDFECGGIYLGKSDLVLNPSGNNKYLFQSNWINVGMSGDDMDFSQAQRRSLLLNDSSNLYLRPETNASILLYDPIKCYYNVLDSTSGIANIVQDGPGTVRLWNGWDNATGQSTAALIGGNVDIVNGRFLAMRNAIFLSDPTIHQEDNYSHYTSPLDFTVRSGGTLGFSVDRFGGHSRIVSETFKVEDGAQLYVSDISMLDVGTVATYRNVVESTAAVDGSLTTMEVDNGMMHARLLLNGANQVDLEVLSVNSIASQLGGNASFIDQMRRSPDLPEILRWELDDLYHYGQWSPGMEDLFHAVSGTENLNAMHALRTNARLFHQTMLRQMSDIEERAGRHNRLPAGFFIRNCSRYLHPDQLWGTFTHDWTRQNTSESFRSDYTYRPYMFTVGKDRLNGLWKTGFAFQYAHGTTRSGGAAHFTNTTLDSGTLGLYAGRSYGKNYLMMTAQVGLGYNDAATYYHEPRMDTDAGFLSGTLGAGFELGRVIRFGCETHPWDITPHIGLEYLYAAHESYIENGGRIDATFCQPGSIDLQRAFDNMDYHVLELPVGFRTSKTFMRENGMTNWIKPYADLMYVRSLADNAPMTKVAFANNRAFPWEIRGTDLGRDVFRMNAGIASLFLNRVNLDVSYGLEARRGYTSQQLNASISCRW